MKKLFKYEINESVAAKAAMNCVHKRLFKELYAFGTPMPQEEVARGEYDPYEWEFDDYGNEDKRHLVLQALVQAGLIQSEEEGLSLNNKIQQLLDKTNFSVSNEQDAMKFVKTYGQQIVGETQEQEEDGINKGGMHNLVQHGHIMNTPSFEEQDDDEETYTAYDDTDGIWMIINLMRKKGMLRAQGIDGRDDVDDGLAIDKAYDLIEQKLNDEGMWIDDDYEAEKFVSAYGDEIAAEAMKSALHNQEQEEDGINKGGMHNLVQVGHIMNTPSMHDTYDSEWFSDREEQDAYDDAFRLIAELAADQIDRENLDAKGIENNMDTLFDITKEVWKKDSIDLIDFMLSEVDEDECQNFLDEHYEEIKNEYMKREHDNIMSATHDDLFASENEEENHSNDNHGIKMIMDIMIANRLMSNDPSSRQIAWKLIQRKLNEEGMWIGDDKAKAEEFVSSFGEDLEEEISYWRW